MRYLMLIKHTEDYRKQTVPAGLYEAMGEFVGAGFKSGAIIDTAGLKPTVDGNRVQLRGRKITVTDVGVLVGHRDLADLLLGVAGFAGQRTEHVAGEAATHVVLERVRS